MMKRILAMVWIAVAPLTALSGCGDGEVRIDGADSVAALLRAMPDWASFRAGVERPEEQAEVNRLAEQIATYPLDTIRRGMEIYYVEKPDQMIKAEGRLPVVGALRVDGTLLIVNRFLFAVPPTVRRDSPHFRTFGGVWLGMPITGDPHHPADSDEMDMRWPWSVDEAGQWTLTGTLEGFVGPPYNPFEAFDYCRTHFQPRAISNAGGRAVSDRRTPRGYAGVTGTEH